MQACGRARSFTLKAFALLAFTAASSAPLAAQVERAPANCTYESCALGLAPAWNGLAITRGIAQRQIAVLGFFYPDDIRPVFADNPQALEAAEEALRTRTVGAILTDAGLLLLGTGLGVPELARLDSTVARTVRVSSEGRSVAGVP